LLGSDEIIGRVYFTPASIIEMDRLKRQQSLGGHVRENNLVVVVHSAGRDAMLQPATDFAPERQR
jgi:hypothetical protein